MRKIMAVAALPLMFVSTAAWAQDEDAAAEEESSGAWEFDAEVGLNSDYRFRGVSLSTKDAEGTAEITVSHESGLYFGAWASNVALIDNADNVEVDIYAGYAKDVASLSFDVGAVYYSYPGHNGEFGYVDLLASVSTTVGPATVTVGGAYAPSQGNIGHEDNTYVYVSGDLPLGETPLSLHGTFGFEDGAFGDNKKDWLVGATFDLGGGLSATVDYVDTAHTFNDPLADANVVGRVLFAF